MLLIFFVRGCFCSKSYVSRTTGPRKQRLRVVILWGWRVVCGARMDRLCVVLRARRGFDVGEGFLD